jgi:uncharacterized OB-fold protein
VSAPYPRPDPVADEEIRFWSFVAAGELRLQRCASCGAYRHPPRPLCAACGSHSDEWVVASGRGEVWATTMIHPPTLPAFAARTPYNAVVVRLDEGVFLVTNVVDGSPDDVAVGAAVELAITEVEPALTLPLFRPVSQRRS